MANKDFGLTNQDLDKGSGNFKVNVIKDGDTIYKAELFRRRTFCGFDMGWIFHKNLWEPVNKKTKEIEDLKDKIKVAELAKEQLRKEAMTLVITFGGDMIFEPQQVFKGSKDSKPKPFNEAFSAGKEEKPKDKGRVMKFDMQPAPAQNNNQQKANQNQK